MGVIYKIVCEVKLLHEYYLTRSKGENIFDLPAQKDRLNFLLQQFQNGGKTINQDIDFDFPESLQQLYKNYYLKIIPSYSGFKIAVKCSSKILQDGSRVFQPFIALPDKLDMMILLQQKNNISSFSNTLLKKTFAPLLYFSNDNFPAAKTAGFLSNPVPLLDSSKIYEQGEMALFAGNAVKIFLNNNAPDPWQLLNKTILDGTNYVNESDRLLVALSFSYSFAVADNITDASFSLKDFNGNEVKKITVTNSKPLRSVLLNFGVNNNLISSLPEKSPDAESFYTLNVAASNGYSRSYKIIFVGNQINLTNAAGLIGLKTKVANPQFNLIDSDGLLHTRILPDGSRQSPPVFELWMKSRLVFWKFSNNRRNKIKTTLDTQDVLTNVDDDEDGIADGVLVTKNPIPLCYTPLLTKKPNSTFQYLPNPLPGDLVKLEGTKNIINILVAESNLFPLA